MADQFPEIKPTTRKFKMGDTPSTTYTSLSGAIFKRSFGNVKTNYTLDLTFKNIPDSTTENFKSTEAILTHYEGADGTFSSFTIPDLVFAGVNSNVKGYIQAPTGIKWRYSRPPEVQSVQSNLSTVTVSLIGEIEAPQIN
jgi:hypothetical protein